MHRRLPRPTATLALLLSTGLLTACPAEGEDDEAGDTVDTTAGDSTEGDTATEGTEGADGNDANDTTASDTTGETTSETTGDPTETTGETDPTGMAGCGNDPGWGPLAEGELVKHIQGFDQTGAEFNMCEYAGTPIIIDVAAVWCGPCNAVSDYFANGGTDPFGAGIGDSLTTMIANDTVIWLTTLVEDANSAPATVEIAAMWDAQYPNPKIPVVVEGDIQMLPGYFQLGCWPSAFIVDHEMKWMGFDDCQTWNQLVEVIQTYGG